MSNQDDRERDFTHDAVYDSVLAEQDDLSRSRNEPMRVSGLSWFFEGKPALNNKWGWCPWFHFDGAEWLGDWQW
jgi:hypothetical protein